VGVSVSFDDPDEVAEDAAGADIDDRHLANVQSHLFSVAQGQQELLAVEEIKDRIKLLDHQLNAAHRALFQLGGGALFADEVGLGKTIEVGMVIKENDFRETHDSFLILTPAQLAPQWQEELQNKFGLDFVCNYDEDFQGFEAHDKIVASVDTAKTKAHIEAVTSHRWDVLVLDEAHYIRNADTQRYELIKQLNYGNAYFATATPIQNDITELYNIINLIRPGLLGTRQEFNRRYVVDGDATQIRNREELQQKLDRVMIRNRREETDIDFTNRDVRTNTFEPTDVERKLYEEVSDYVRTHYSSRGAKHLVLLLLQKEVVSSPAAVKSTVEGWLHGDGRTPTSSERSDLQSIRDLVDEIDETTKQRRLRQILNGMKSQMETPRMVVFTQFRATQDEIEASVRETGLPVHVVNGDLSSKAKSRKVNEFEAEGGVMVATDSISEGRNMQFCNVLVNYDLPWNPMKVEQRIGRIDRIGQDREVLVYNLALDDTVEGLVLEKLYGKIDLFSQSIGGLREILSRMEQSGADFEQEVFESLRKADSTVELENNFEEMAVDLEENKEAAEKMGNFNERVFESFEFSEGSE
jgi:SNF2 family DNA or RNA helicase